MLADGIAGDWCFLDQVSSAVQDVSNGMAAEGFGGGIEIDQE